HPRRSPPPSSRSTAAPTSPVSAMRCRRAPTYARRSTRPPPKAARESRGSEDRMGLRPRPPGGPRRSRTSEPRAHDMPLSTPNIVRLAALAGGLAMGTPCGAEEASFFAGKSIQLVVGFDVGGGYDLYARTVARHWSRHIPGNPTFIPQNM